MSVLRVKHFYRALLYCAHCSGTSFCCSVQNSSTSELTQWLELISRPVISEYDHERGGVPVDPMRKGQGGEKKGQIDKAESEGDPATSKERKHEAAETCSDKTSVKERTTQRSEQQSPATFSLKEQLRLRETPKRRSLREAVAKTVGELKRNREDDLLDMRSFPFSFLQKMLGILLVWSYPQYVSPPPRCPSLARGPTPNLILVERSRRSLLCLRPATILSITA